MSAPSYFEVRVGNKPGVPYYYIVNPKIRTNLRRLSFGMVEEIRGEILPEFMRSFDLNADQSGFRLVIESDRRNNSFNCHLMAGEGVPAQNPQDWTTSTRTRWKRRAEGDPPSFFDLCAEAASRNAPEMKFGNAMLYPNLTDGVFGVKDGDPKAELHFLVLAGWPCGNMADTGFTSQLWYAFFLSALRILIDHNADNHHIRYIANCGSGFQVGPRVHMHVLASIHPLPSVFPSDYGFEISPDGTIKAPYEGKEQEEIIKLIRQRALIQGFSEKARIERKRLDSDLLRHLAGARIS